MANKLIIRATDAPVSIEEVRDHLVENNTDKDAYIGALIAAATDLCEGRVLRSIMPQTREETLDQFPDYGGIELSYPPVSSILSVSYADGAGVVQILAPDSYVLDNADDFGPHWIELAPGRAWPQTLRQINALRVRYVAGYENAAAVPPGIMQYIKLMVGNWYANREAIGSAGSMTTYDYVEKLLHHYRVY